MIDSLLHALHEEITKWYKNAYENIDKYQEMIEYYSYGTPEKVEYLLQVFEKEFRAQSPKKY